MRTLLLTSMLLSLATTTLNSQNQVPCTFDFSTQEKFAEWTVIDGNPSSTPYIWEYDSDSQAATCNSASEAADDWIISPSVELKAGKSYNITISVKSSGSWDYQDFSITAGQTPTIEGQTEIYKATDFRSTFYSDKEATFTPTADGNYHFAVRCTSSRLNGDLYLKSLTVETIPQYPAQITDLTVESGADGALEAILNWTMPTTDSNGSPLENLTGARIERKNGSSIWGSFNKVAEVAGKAGEKITYTDNTLTTSGTYEYRVIAYNDNGDAQGTVTSVETGYIGEDTPNPVTELTASVMGGVSVEVNFTKPTTGENGGYVNLDALTYKIERISGRESTVLEANYAGTLPYSDNTITELSSYRYKVTVVDRNGKTSEPAESNTIVTGPAFTVPYAADLSDEETAELFTFLDNDNDKKTWSYSSYRGAIAYSGSADNADDWAISPKIKLEKGKAYKISFVARLSTATNESNYKNVAIALGTTPTVEGMTIKAGNVTISGALSETYDFTVNVPESGEYNVGMQVNGETDYNSVYVTSLTVEEVEIAPLAPENVTATRAEKGMLQATISWKNPVTDNAGGTIESITKYQVLRGEDVVGEFNSTEPGKEESYIDSTIPQPGIYTYSVRIFLGENYSEASATTEWVGNDTPTPVTELQASVTDDNKVTLSFKAPTSTVNGGYLETEGMGYRILRNDEEIESCYTAELPYVDTVEELSVYTYSVSPVTASGLTGEATESNSVVAGNAKEIPYEADFANKDDYTLCTVVDANGDEKTWSYSSYDKAAQIGTNVSTEGDWLFTPKLKLQASYEYEVTITASLYRAWSESSYTTINIGIGKNATAESQTKEGTHIVDSALDAVYKTKFIAKESANYNLGIQSMGNEDYQYLSVKKISVTATGVSGVDAISATGNLRYNRQNCTIECYGDGILEIHDVSGTSLISETADKGSVDVSELPKGIYIATFTSQNGEKNILKFIR